MHSPEVMLAVTKPLLSESVHSSVERIVKTASNALDTALENGATLKEANDWLALILTNTTIQLHPNSYQLDPANMTKLSDSLMDVRGTRKTAAIMEEIIIKAKNKNIDRKHFYFLEIDST